MRTDLALASYDEAQAFKDYVNLWIQRIPKYATKPAKGGCWRTKNKPLADPAIEAHLRGQYNVAVLGQCYPSGCLLDIDERNLATVHEIRESLGLDEENSMAYTSESVNSYYLAFRPQYKGQPSHLRLLQKVLRNFAKTHQIEVFPQWRHPVRLPFSPLQKMLDYEYHHLNRWEERLYWFLKLDPFDLSTVRCHQLELDLQTPGQTAILPTILAEGKELFEHGLQCPSSREQGQFKVLYYLWRLNVPQRQAEEITWHWIRTKNNGFSEDILRHPIQVRRHISRQAKIIYMKYELAGKYPDTVHNSHHGFITASDIPKIIAICEGSMPRMKFLFSLLKFSYPRRHRNPLTIHTNRLIEWSSKRTYQQYTNELALKGIAERGRYYEPGIQAKSLRLKWNYRNPEEAVYLEGRSVDTFKDTVRFLYKRDEFKQLLRNAGVKRQTAHDLAKRVFRASRKVET